MQQKECDYYCPNCRNLVFFKKRNEEDRPFFSIMLLPDCQVFSEAESEEHLNLKRQCFRWLKKSYPRVEMEGYLSQLMQRPDILAGHHAFEIQCSPLSYERMIERTINYKANGYVVWWLLGMKFFKRNDCLRLEKKVLLLRRFTTAPLLAKSTGLRKRFTYIVRSSQTYRGKSGLNNLLGPFLRKSY